MSERSSLLQALNLFNSVSPHISLPHIIAFLHVAENEGLIINDLVALTGMTQSTASRSLRANGPRDSSWSVAPATGLLEPYLDASDRRKHAAYLTPLGRQLVRQLDEVILSGRLIGWGDAPLERAAV